MSEGFGILLLENSAGITATDFPLLVYLMEVEAIRIRTFVASQKMGTIFGGPEGDLQRSF